jgi:hypothetical protein
MSLYRAGSLMAAARELATYILDFVGVQEVRWDKGGTVSAGDYNCFLDRRIILRWIFRKWDVGLLTGLSWLRIRTGGGHL